MSTPFVLVLCIASGAFYVAAAAVLKLGSGLPFLLLVLPVYLILGLAAWFESVSLQGNRFGIVVLVILGSEVLITAAVALVLGERYGKPEIAGLALIVVGMAVVCGAEAARAGHVAADKAGSDHEVAAPVA